MNEKIYAVVNYIVKEGTENTTSGNWHVSYDELGERFSFATAKWLDENLIDIVDELDLRDELLSETWLDTDEHGRTNGFDCNFCLVYCPLCEGEEEN